MKGFVILICLVFILSVVVFAQPGGNNAGVNVIILEEPIIVLSNGIGRTVNAELNSNGAVACEINWDGIYEEIDIEETSDSYSYSEGGLKTVYYRCYAYLPKNEFNFVTVEDSIKILIECEIDADCDDGLNCNGQETCQEGVCVEGMPIDCSGNDLAEIATCDNSPDSNPFTLDFFAGFISECVEPGTCTTGTIDLTHNCDVENCQAGCDASNPCTATECDYKDGCVGNNYYDYSDVPNACLDSCSCETNTCGEPTISYNDPRCFTPECTADYQCGHLSRSNYCSGSEIVYKVGKCINYRCIAQTFLVEDCDDNLYCNGQEICNPATVQCQSGTAVDCSGNDLAEIATCDNSPDSNPFTWDYRPGFTSQCDEASDSCTTRVGSIIQHSCDKERCQAECETNADCNDGDALTVDICKSNCVCKHNFQQSLTQGWNTITLTIHPKNTDITNVLSSIEGKYKNVWLYRDGKWLDYSPTVMPWLSNLKDIYEGETFQIEMTQSGTLYIVGS